MDEHSNEWIPWHWRLWQLVINEFDFSFPKFDIIPRKRTIIMWLEGFDVVNIIKLNLNKTWVRDLAIHVSHARMYTRLHVWLKIKDGARSWITINCHQHRYWLYAIFVQPFEYWIAWKGWGNTKGKGFVVPYNNYFTPS
jgi:hypothetical protein